MPNILHLMARKHITHKVNLFSDVLLLLTSFLFSLWCQGKIMKPCADSCFGRLLIWGCLLISGPTLRVNIECYWYLQIKQNGYLHSMTVQIIFISIIGKCEAQCNKLMCCKQGLYKRNQIWAAWHVCDSLIILRPQHLSFKSWNCNFARWKCCLLSEVTRSVQQVHFLKKEKKKKGKDLSYLHTMNVFICKCFKLWV